MLGLVIVLSSCTTTIIPVPLATVQQAVVEDAIEITDPHRVKPIAITKVSSKIRKGTVVGSVGLGGRVGATRLCIYKRPVMWRVGNNIWLDSEDLVDVFREELELHGWPVVGLTKMPFEDYDLRGAEVLVAAKITDLETILCAPLIGLGNPYRRGSMRIVIEWQVYSPARRSLIGTIETEGSAEISKLVHNTPPKLLAQSFIVAVNNLLASSKFLGLVERSEGLTPAPPRPDGGSSHQGP